MEKNTINFGYEIMPIVVSVKGNICDENTKIELIDGFKRMFCIDEIPNIDVLVKVYKNFSDSEWINTMIIHNSWKFTKNSDCSNYMDRGFQLSIYFRYGLKLSDVKLPIHYNMFKLLNIYSGKIHFMGNYYCSKNIFSLYNTLWNNEMFFKDLVIIKKILIISIYSNILKEEIRLKNII